MIERDMLQYLQGVTALTNKLGGVGKIFPFQAPTGKPNLMPWLIVEPTGGSRDKISASKIEEINSVRITVDAGPNALLTGREAIELAKTAVENYRGTMEGAEDIHVTCSAIGGWSGLNGAYRWQFSARCRWVETYTEPVVTP